MDLSIIIVNWNTRELLASCLQSVSDNLRATAGLKVETFVVDNASADGSAAMVREHFPWVRLLENGQNAGFAQANNQAIRQSGGRYLLLLNPDTEVRPGALAALFSFMEAHPEAGAAGARLLNTDGSLQPSCTLTPTPGRELWLLLHLDALYPRYARYAMSEWDTGKPRAVEVLKGACLLLRREALDQAGPFDEEYFMYSEEVDLCRRIRLGGWQIYWVPQAEVIHYEGQSTRQVATNMFLHLYQAKLFYFRKNGGRRAAWRYKLVLLAAALPRLALSPLAWLERPPARQRHLALAGRYWQLVRLLPGL